MFFVPIKIEDFKSTLSQSFLKVGDLPLVLKGRFVSDSIFKKDVDGWIGDILFWIR
jgi:hypothetical protein